MFENPIFKLEGRCFQVENLSFKQEWSHSRWKIEFSNWNAEQRR